MIKKLVHFAYFVKSTNWQKLRNQSIFVIEAYRIPKLKLFMKMCSCAYKYGISFHEYFYYGCYNKDNKSIKEYASMSFVHEYEKKYNSKRYVDYLNDKLLFNEKYSDLVKRRWFNPQKAELEEIENMIQGQSKIVLKRSKGTIGQDVLVLDLQGTTAKELKEKCLLENFNLMEEFVEQHHELQSLSPNSLNTIRIMTHLNEDNSVDILGAMLRMGITKKTDNFSTGGIAASIDISTGVVIRDAVSVDISQPPFSQHPVSNIKIKGFKIPYWKECIEMIEAAAVKYPYNRTVGWDIAVRENGPILIEGNHNWWAGIWQMTEGKGMKSFLLKYMM